MADPTNTTPPAGGQLDQHVIEYLREYRRQVREVIIENIERMRADLARERACLSGDPRIDRFMVDSADLQRLIDLTTAAIAECEGLLVRLDKEGDPQDCIEALYDKAPLHHEAQNQAMNPHFLDVWNSPGKAN